MKLHDLTPGGLPTAPTTRKVKAGWVLSELRTGDELGSQPTHAVPRSNNLAELYALTARAIVEGNGVAWSTAAIERWVLETGGERNALGTPTFTNNSRIYLPPNGPRPPVVRVEPQPQPQKRSGVVGWLLALGGAVAGVVAISRR